MSAHPMWPRGWRSWPGCRGEPTQNLWPGQRSPALRAGEGPSGLSFQTCKCRGFSRTPHNCRSAGWGALVLSLPVQREICGRAPAGPQWTSLLPSGRVQGQEGEPG